MTKQKVAFLSVLAAVFLTGFKLIVGVSTGSLGILSEALHSGLDFIAAVITLFAVRMSDKPADKDHHYGHGKIENLSALIETVLLLVTCIWILYEAIHRLTTGKTEISVTMWSFVVVIISIIVDYTRAKQLNIAAKKYNSQALEADALHFSTDIWSSLVVLFGLVCSMFGYFYADAIAAMLVAVIVLFVSYKLGVKAINVLLDKVPDDHIGTIQAILNQDPNIKKYTQLKVRSAGAETFVDVTIFVDHNCSFKQSHDYATLIEEKIMGQIDRSQVVVHVEPYAE